MYPLNTFPTQFLPRVAQELVAILATRGYQALEGDEWERIFALAIDGEWRRSNVGLDDIVKDSTAWGAKTVKNPRPHTTTGIRLICGRNNPEYWFGSIAGDDDGIGAQVLRIWNDRVDTLRETYGEGRTVVLIKPNDFEAERIPFAIYEFATEKFDVERYTWRRNARGNLQGHDRATDAHKFTWQRHGSQFTVIESIPENRIKFFLRKPEVLSTPRLMGLVGYNDSWVEIA